MDAAGIEKILMALGVSKFNRSGEDVNCQCILAEWTHPSGKDNRPSMGIKISEKGKSIYQCLSCHRTGSLLGLLCILRQKGRKVDAIIEWTRERERVSLQRSLEIAAEAHLEIPEAKDTSEMDVWDEREFEPFKGRVPRYLLNRNIPMSIAKEFDLGYDEGEGRLVFPIRRIKDNALVGLVGRAIKDGVNPKYKNYWSFSKSKDLYGENRVSLKDADETPKELPGHEGLILCEGMFDVLRLWSYGYKNAMCIFGTSPSRVQIEKILEYSRPVYMLFDWDSSGDEARRLLFPELVGRVSVYDVSGPAGKDPDDLPKDELLACIKNAKRVDSNLSGLLLTTP
jgi:hypothetical protein